MAYQGGIVESTVLEWLFYVLRQKLHSLQPQLSGGVHLYSSTDKLTITPQDAEKDKNMRYMANECKTTKLRILTDN